MKSLACTTAVVSTVLAFSLTLLLTVQVQNTSLVATVLEQGESSSVQQKENKLLPEKVTITYDFGRVELPRLKIMTFFPEIEDRAQPLTITNAPYCPFTSETGSMIIDFTNNGTVPLEEIYLYANKETEDRKITSAYVDVGTYVVELASYNSEEVEENNYEQQWYLEFRNVGNNVVYTTQSTRDMYVGESEMIELVEQNMVLDTAVSHVQALHTAFPDTEPQTIAPLCARLSKQTQEKGNIDTVQRDENNLFSAAVLLEQATNQSKNHFLFSLGVILTLLTAMGVILGSTILPKN